MAITIVPLRALQFTDSRRPYACMVQTGSQRRQRRLAIGVGLFAALAMIAVDAAHLFEWGELRTLDWRFRNVAAIPLRDDIAIIAIDDQALRDVGRWPWPRDVQAGLIRVLHEAGARSILVDLNWVEPEPIRGRSPPGFDMLADQRDFVGLGVDLVCPDLKLADAVSDAGNCYLSYSLDDQPVNPTSAEREFVALRDQVRAWLAADPARWTAAPPTLGREFLSRVSAAPFDRETDERNQVLSALRVELSLHASTAGATFPADAVRDIARRSDELLPVYYLHARAARRNGFVNFMPDSDGRVRRQWLFAQAGGQVVTQVAFSLVFDEFRVDAPRSQLRGAGLQLVGVDGRDILSIPLDSTGRMLIPWAHREGDAIQFAAVSAKSLTEIDRLRTLVDRNVRALKVARNQLMLHSAPARFQQVAEQLIADEADAQATSFAARYAAQDAVAREHAANATEIDGELSKLESQLVAAAGQADEDSAEAPALRSFMAAREELEHQRTFAALKNDQLLRSASEAIENLKPLIHGKICLIGYTATAQGDIVATPLAPQTPGVLAHAHLINGLLNRRVINWTPGWLNYVLAGLLGAAAAAVGALLRPRLALTLCVALGTAYFILAALLFRVGDLWMPLVAPLMSMFAAYTALTVYQYFFAEAQRRRLSTALTQFTSPEIARQVADNPELCRKAETREVTAMFTDLRGFTPISERIGAERTQRVLNACLERFCKVLLRREAIINKFMGDGVFAFWNPLIYPQPDHARLGCEAALELIAALRALIEEQARAGGDEAFGDLYLRIGVATGSAVVGPCGSEQKFDYTCIGDCVNVAARLESTNKTFDTRILVNDEVRRRAGEGFVFRPLGGVRVKGKQIPVQVFELLGRAGEETGDESAYLTAFGEAIAAFHRREFAAARKRFEQCLTRRSDDKAAAAYVNACRGFEESPPPADWQPAIDAA
ncbi:MAG: adenylate/guanylate cyclase domain-containing protein [Phycisphaerales bacterium]|nr:adenylate/guanylate cyclase domain-containing protein [Phycisphaerales bacterium]